MQILFPPQSRNRATAKTVSVGASMRIAPMANREDEEDDGEAEGGENAL